MLLFKPVHIQMIQNGIKVETRRLWEKCRVKVDSTQLIKTQIFTKENFGRVAIMYCRQELLLEITEEGARREGNYTRDEYLKLWTEINPKSPDNPLVWVVGFIYLGKGEK